MPSTPPPSFGWSPSPRTSPAGRMRALMIDPAPRLVLERVELRGLGLAELGIELLAGFLAERLQIGSLGPRHRFVAGHPVLRILFRGRLRILLCRHRRCP